MIKRIPETLLFMLAVIIASSVGAQSPALMSGLQVIEEVQRRHYLDVSIYEELSMIMTDHLGNRDTRSMRRYISTDASGNMKYLLVLDTPLEMHGAALLANRTAAGDQETIIYLPAFGEAIRAVQRHGDVNTLLGMDFSLEDLSWERPVDYQYVRRENEKMGNSDYIVVDVFEANAAILSAIPLKRHYVHEQGFYVMRTEYFDKLGRIFKRQTLHDIKQQDQTMWSAGMILMENLRDNHNTLIKVNRRVVSTDYVPDDVFTMQWLYQNQPPLQIEDPAVGIFEINLQDHRQPVFYSSRQLDNRWECMDRC